MIFTFCGNQHILFFYEGFFMLYMYPTYQSLFILYPRLYIGILVVLTLDLFILVRSRVKLIYHTYVLVSIELQNLYLVPQSILLQLIFGQLAVFLLNCFWARFVPLFCFHTHSRHHHHLLQNDVFLLVSATYLSSDTILSFVAVIPWWKCSGPTRTYYKGAWNTHPGGSTLHESQLQRLQVSANKSTPMAQGLHLSLLTADFLYDKNLSCFENISHSNTSF